MWTCSFSEFVVVALATSKQTDLLEVTKRQPSTTENKAPVYFCTSEIQGVTNFQLDVSIIISIDSSLQHCKILLSKFLEQP